MATSTGVNKTKGLFDHLRQITSTQDPKYWETLTDSDRKSWSNYMVLRFLSMNPDWTEIINQIQTVGQTLPPETLYRLLIGIIPKSRSFLKYIKGDKTPKYETWLVDFVKTYYLCSSTEAKDYLAILYGTKEGQEAIKELCVYYGVEKKNITKLKLKLLK